MTYERTAPLHDARLHVRVPADELRRWRERARLERITLTELIRRALGRKHKEGDERASS